MLRFQPSLLHESSIIFIPFYQLEILRWSHSYKGSNEDRVCEWRKARCNVLDGWRLLRTPSVHDSTSVVSRIALRKVGSSKTNLGNLRPYQHLNDRL